MLSIGMWKFFLKTSLFHCIEKENIVWNKENFIDILRLIPCLSNLNSYEMERYIPITDELREHRCNMELLINSADNPE